LGSGKAVLEYGCADGKLSIDELAVDSSTLTASNLRGLSRRDAIACRRSVERRERPSSSIDSLPSAQHIPAPPCPIPMPQQRDLRRADLADRDIPAPDVGARVDRILGEAPV